jgi:hypothetical protein
MSALISFGKLGGPVYVGRSNGERAREKLGIAELDIQHEPIDVEIPENTYSINSSYFLGMFGASVVALGSTEAFFKHYKFKGPRVLLDTIESHADRALREQGVLKLA